MRIKRTLLHIVLATAFWGTVFGAYEAMQPRCRIPNSAAAIGNLRNYGAAQHNFRSTHGRYGNPAELARNGLLDDWWHDGATRDSYSFRLSLASDGSDFTASAEPFEERRWWSRAGDDWYFFLNSDYSIRRAYRRPATPSDPPLE